MSDTAKIRQEEIFQYGIDGTPDAQGDRSEHVTGDGEREADMLSVSVDAPASVSPPISVNTEHNDDVITASPANGDTQVNAAEFVDSGSTDVIGIALSMFDDSDVARVRSSITADAGLYAELATMESVAAVYAQLAPRHDINRGRSAGIRSRLIARAASSSDGLGIGIRAGGVRAARSGQAVPATSSEARKKPRGQSASRSAPKQAFVPPVSDVPRILVKAHTDEHRATVPVIPVPIPVVEQRVAPSPIVTPRSSGVIRAGVWITLALVLAALVGGAQEWRMRLQQEKLQNSTGARDATLTAQVTELEEKVFAKDSAIKALTAQRMRVVPLNNYGSKAPLAKVFWNQATSEWAVYTYDMASPRPGKTYQVWLVTNTSAPVSLGTFDPKPENPIALETTYVLSPAALTQILVSEEPIGGSAVRTGAAVVAGR